MLLNFKIFLSYFLLCVITIITVLTINPFFLLLLLFCFVGVLSFLFFTLQLYLFTLIFLSVYAGAVLVLFLFVFMFLSSDTLFLVKFSNNSKMLLVFLWLFLSFLYFWNTFDYNTETITMGQLGFVPQSEIVFFGLKLYIEFGFCFMFVGFIFFTILIGVAELVDNHD